MLLLCRKFLLFLVAVLNGGSQAFAPSCHRSNVARRFLPSAVTLSAEQDKPAGSFFNEVPENSGPDGVKGGIDGSLDDLLKERKKPAKASEPSTIQGVPTSEAKGFAKANPSGTPSSKKPYIGVGAPDKPLNDIQTPEYDDQGYMLYADEETGEKKRVFEALVEYPSVFTMKIVGENTSTFVEDMVQVVADSCDKEVEDISYSTKEMGKWVSVTVEAPVENAEMLYSLYENVDRDPRVKFKF